MDKRKGSLGFTLVEVLIVMSIFILLSSLFFSTIKFENGYVESIESLQITSMEGMRRVNINEKFWFNRNGNINHSGHFDYGKKKCLIYLGYGRYACE